MLTVHTATSKAYLEDDLCNQNELITSAVREVINGYWLAGAENGTEDKAIWHGRQADYLGLYGEVVKEDYANLYDGKHPITGQDLVRKADQKKLINKAINEKSKLEKQLKRDHGNKAVKRKLDKTIKHIESLINGETEHRPGVDFTLSFCKDHSLAWATVNEQQRAELEAAEQLIFKSTIDNLESMAYVRKGWGKDQIFEKADGICAGIFTHSSARPVDYTDPKTGKTEKRSQAQRHGHLFIYNTTRDQNGKAMSLNTDFMGQAKTRALEDAKAHAILAQVHRKQGRQLTVNILTDGTRRFGLAAVEQSTATAQNGSTISLREAFSLRTKNIKDKLAELESKAAKAAAERGEVPKSISLNIAKLLTREDKRNDDSKEAVIAQSREDFKAFLFDEKALNNSYAIEKPMVLSDDAILKSLTELEVGFCERDVERKLWEQAQFIDLPSNLSLEEIKKHTAAWVDSKKLELLQSKELVDLRLAVGNLPNEANSRASKFQSQYGALPNEAIYTTRIAIEEHKQIQVDIKEMQIDGACKIPTLRSQLYADGKIGEGKIFKVKQDKEFREMEIAVGDRLLLRKNDKKSGLWNGQQCTVQGFDDQGKAIVLIDGDKERRTIDFKQYQDVQRSFAITIHKSQGISINKALLWYEQEGAELSLVGMTRHKDDLEIYCNAGVKDDLAELMSKSNPKNDLQDLGLILGADNGFENLQRLEAPRFTLPTAREIAKDAIEQAKETVSNAFADAKFAIEQAQQRVIELTPVLTNGEKLRAKLPKQEQSSAIQPLHTSKPIFEEKNKVEPEKEQKSWFKKALSKAIEFVEKSGDIAEAVGEKTVEIVSKPVALFNEHHEKEYQKHIAMVQAQMEEEEIEKINEDFKKFVKQSGRTDLESLVDDGGDWLKFPNKNDITARNDARIQILEDEAIRQAIEQEQKEVADREAQRLRAEREAQRQAEQQRPGSIYMPYKIENLVEGMPYEMKGNIEKSIINNKLFLKSKSENYFSLENTDSYLTAKAISKSQKALNADCKIIVDSSGKSEIFLFSKDESEWAKIDRNIENGKVKYTAKIKDKIIDAKYFGLEDELVQSKGREREKRHSLSVS